MSVPFALVDVFGDGPLTGNPLAVVLDAERLADQALPLIAREFNQSETTFVYPAGEPGSARRLRSFTAAGSEVGGAGHNALGAWWWLAARGDLNLAEGPNELVQELGGRRLPLTISLRNGRPRSVGMRQAAAQSGSDLPEFVDRLAKDLGVAPDDLGDRGLLPRVVSTGAAHLLLPVAGRRVLDRVRPEPDRLRNTLADAGAQGCYVYTLEPGDGLEGETGDEVASARFFNPTMGIHEDPATGSAAGPLVARLVAAGILAPDVPHVILQGVAMRRPSRVTATSDGSGVVVSGSAQIVAEGTLSV
jgi:PhzF family phenazine biosynthesis protein